MFGGVTRARISSQCLKRAIRMQAKELCPDLFQGGRSKLIVKPIADAAIEAGLEQDKALEAAKLLCDHLATYDAKAYKDKGVMKVKTLMFLSPAEIRQAGKELAAVFADGGLIDRAAKKKIEVAAKQIQKAELKDAGDIALFGRMVAADHSLTVEGAAMFSHALSTHRADNDIDFYTAVDDR
jgi:CRISPR system Cascade subunit CasC